MSAPENTTIHRNQQRRARARAKAEGLSYQAALELVRTEVEVAGQESPQARVPALTERGGWSTHLLDDEEPMITPLLFWERQGKDEYAPLLHKELLMASKDGVLDRRLLELEVDRHLKALEMVEATGPGLLRSFQEKWLPKLGGVWAWDSAPDPLLVALLADLMVTEVFGPFEGAAPDPLEDLVEELRGLDREVLIEELSERLERLEGSDLKRVRVFECEWAFALSTIDTGGEGHLADDELEKMVAELRLMQEM